MINNNIVSFLLAEPPVVVGCGFQNQTGRYRKDRNLWPYLEMNSMCPNCSLINVVTMGYPGSSRYWMGTYCLLKPYCFLKFLFSFFGLHVLTCPCTVTWKSLWSGNKVTESLPFEELCFNFLYSFYTSIDIVNVSYYFSETKLNGKYEKVCHTLCDTLNRERRWRNVT